MRLHIFVIAAFIAPALVAPASAVTVSRCKDADGSYSYREHCPPDTLLVETQKITGAARAAPTASLSEVAKRSPVALYVLPNCDSCDLVRHLLESRKIPFTEHDVGTDPAEQEKLKALSSSLTVPAVAVGKEVVSGYNRAGIETALKSAGYAISDAPPAAESTR